MMHAVVLPAFAHPFTVDTEPVGFAQLQQSPDLVIISYSEPVEEAFSTIKVTNSSGNRVDKGNTKFFQGDQTKLIVTLKPLSDDVYTVKSKVLSQVDGHVVEYIYAFIVGSAEVPFPTDVEAQSTQPAVYLPESFSRFPGLVGQVIIVGISFASLFLWRPIERLENFHSTISQVRSFIDRRFAILLVIGVILVISSGFAMIIVHAESLGVNIITAITTGFGNTWLVRMFIAFIILGLYFVVRRKNPIRKNHHIVILAVGLALLATTTMMGHGAATMQSAALVLDFIHNIAASAWIGGLIYLGFVAIPSLRYLGLSLKSAVIALLIPRFSMMTVVILGIVAITGPLLLWILESNINSLVITFYGKILISKFIFAGFMIGIGAFNQFKIHGSAIANIKARGTAQVDVHSRFNKSLKIESVIGVALLLSVALLTNTSLPEGELSVQTSTAEGMVDNGVVDGMISGNFTKTQFTDNAIVNISIEPARVGLNNFVVNITDRSGSVIDDIQEVQVKLIQAREGIGPLISNPTKISDTRFDDNTAFTTNGRWSVEVLAQRQTGLNIVTVFDIIIKPGLNELGFEVEEYVMPVTDSLPLYPLYNNGDLWISETAKPIIWKFNIETNQFKQYDVSGNLTTILHLDSKGNVWFLDPVSRTFGYLEPQNGKFKTYPTPSSGLPISLDIDFNDNVWFTLLDKNTIVKFRPSTEEFEIFKSPTEESQPAAIIVDDFGIVWFTQAAAGKIGKIDPETGSIEEFIPPNGPMAEPFALMIDKDTNIWIGEHVGPKVTRFDPLLQTFTSYLALNETALPYGMSLDKFGNVWFAQHVYNNIGVLNPHSGNILDVPLPTQSSFVQWLATDDTGKIWFAEQRGAKIGSVTITQRSITIPISEPTREPMQQLLVIRYVDVVAPSMSIAIVVSSLFYTKSVHDLRKTIRLIKKSFFK